MLGTSLFSSVGIAETYLQDVDVHIRTANEIIHERAVLHKNIHPNTQMIEGDISDERIFKEILSSSGNVEFLMATPPCQGMSVAGKNRSKQQMMADERNYLVFRIIEFIKAKRPKFVLIENVPTFLKIELPYKNKLYKVVDILSLLFKDKYVIEADIYDAAEFGIPQRRNRAIIKLYEKGRKWGYPSRENIITVENAIGHLPSLEAGEKSNIKWHYARKHSEKHVFWMKNTPTGKSAFENDKFYPTKPTGEKIKGYMTTYRRIKWDEPAPTITMRNDAISSQLNVHPGRQLVSGLYSDARVLTPLELMLLSSLPYDWKIPNGTPELLLRKVIGECVPPMLIKKIVQEINH